MDLVVFNPGLPNRLHDVVVTNPVTAAVSRSGTTNLTSSCMDDSTADQGEAVSGCGNQSRHASSTRASHRGLRPMGDDFSNMFNHFITLGTANTNIPRAILANYWRRRISVCLQSGVRSHRYKHTN
jgi:hypothetical protein